jgi:hypothetical protein
LTEASKVSGYCGERRAAPDNRIAGMATYSLAETLLATLVSFVRKD